MRTMKKVALVSGCLFVGSYGCRQVIGWEEATYWGDGGSGGAGGLSESSSSSVGGMAGAAGAGGMGGMAGAGGMAGVGGMGGSDAGVPECMVPTDCPTLPNSMRTCTNGLCGFTCNTGFGNCNAAPGCETVLTDNRNNCGMCGNACVAYCKGTTCNDPVSIAGGYHHHCAVMKNGDVYCWGRNEKGELGDGTLASKSVPTKVKLTSPAVQVDGGASVTMNSYLARTCAVMVNGELWCWGDGNGTPAKSASLSNIKQVSVGNTHTCALNLSGAVYCWGSNSNGQIGNGGTGYAVTPVQVLTSVRQVSAGGRHTCAVMTNGAVECWGNNGNGQLGIGSSQDQLSPVVVGGVGNIMEASCGDEHTCVTGNGALYCWGANLVGQLGTGNISPSNVPKLIESVGIITVSTAYNFSGAINTGAVAMWGYNGNGQLGNGTTTTEYKPIGIGLTTAQNLGLASTSSCALRVGGELRCWGGNAYGQLGTNGNQQALTPTSVVWQ